MLQLSRFYHRRRTSSGHTVDSKQELPVHDTRTLFGSQEDVAANYVTNVLRTAFDLSDDEVDYAMEIVSRIPSPTSALERLSLLVSAMTVVYRCCEDEEDVTTAAAVLMIRDANLRTVFKFTSCSVSNRTAEEARMFLNNLTPHSLGESQIRLLVSLDYQLISLPSLPSSQREITETMLVPVD